MMMAKIKRRDQNLVWDDNLKVTTKITLEKIVKLTNQKLEFIPVSLTEVSPMMKKVKIVMIID